MLRRVHKAIGRIYLNEFNNHRWNRAQCGKLPFEQTPGSGSGKIKGDLWLKHHINVFLIEVKFYKDDAISTT